MNCFFKATFFALTLVLSALPVWAQSSSDFDAVDLDELLEMDAVNVGSRKPVSKKDVPGNVTVFSAQEIAHLGARNLFDLLRLVPGLDFGFDVNGMVGLGIRGNWASEGKTLFLLNGMPLNETLYGTAGTAHDFPVNQIHRLEITRGPGASYYGGYASLAVVNIITKGAAGSAENGLALLSGTGEDGQMRLAGDVFGAYKKENLNLFGGAYYGNAQFGNGRYEDAQGSTFDIHEDMNIRSLTAYAGGNYGAARFNVLIKQDQVGFRDGSVIYEGASNSYFNWLQAQGSYDLTLSKNWTITPRLLVQMQEPWKVLDDETPFEVFQYDIRALRTTASVLVNGSISQNWTSMSGIEGYLDKATSQDSVNYFDSGESVSYFNGAVFTQHAVKTPFALLNAGLRYDYNSSFGSAFVPWLGVNKSVGDLTLKVLFGQTFRAPAIENVRYATGGNMKPEKTTLGELEAGYQINSGMFASVTVFAARISNVIVYTEDANESIYTNYGTTGTTGIEVEYRYKNNNIGDFNFSYSYYNPNFNEVDVYESGNDKANLAFAPHKISGFGSFYITPRITFNPSFTVLSKRYGYRFDQALYDETLAALPPDATEDDIAAVTALSVQWFDPLLLLNATVRMENVFARGLDLTFGVYDATQSRFGFIQPYLSYASPVYGPAREFILKLQYRF